MSKPFMIPATALVDFLFIKNFFSCARPAFRALFPRSSALMCLAAAALLLALPAPVSAATGGSSYTGGKIISKNLIGTEASGSNNRVTITDGTDADPQDVFGGRSDSALTVTNNTVTISGGNITGFAHAAYNAHGPSDALGNATGNTLQIEGGTIGASVSGAVAGNLAQNNTVIMTGGKVKGDVWGAYSSLGTATNNTVTLSGGTVVKNVYGGYIEDGKGSATYNTITLSGAPTIGGTLYGGSSTETADVRTGNTLEVRSVGLSAQGLEGQSFQHLRFYLPASIRANDTMLTITNNVNITTPAGQEATTVGVGIMGGGTPLAAGDKVNLIKTSGTLSADAAIPNTITGMSGISTVYNFTIGTDPNTLWAEVEGETVSGGTVSDPAIRKSPAEGRAASTTMVTQGADLAAGQGMINARQAASAVSRSGADAVGLGMASFGAISGGTSRYNSGSHVDVDSFSLMTGLAKRWEGSTIDWLAGVFFEAGWGSYNSYNGMANGSTVKGKGDSRYYGGGMLGRLDVTEGLASGVYAEASFRAGKLYSDYRSKDLNPALGQASYDTDASYYGAHAGLGYLWTLNDKASLDMYGKYFWVHTTGSSVNILGDPVTFKAADSHRTRLGTRLSYAVSSDITPYIGVAWDYEFDGKTDSVVAGLDTPAPSLKGSTGMGELGLTWKPAAASVLSVDFGVQGYVGMRQGVNGNMQLRFEF